MKLTGREKWLLFWEGIITIGILVLLDWSVLTIIDQVVHTNESFQIGIFEIKSGLSFGPEDLRIWSYQWLGILIIGGLDLWVLIWRLVRRYRALQMDHILSELHYIAAGNFKHHISFKLNNNLQEIIDSVNAMVDAQIRAREDELAIERSKDEMITNISHDLRTPLTSIIGYLGLVENEYDKLTPELVQKYTHTAYAKATQMKSLVEELFEFAQMQQLDLRLNFEKINLSELLKQLSASFELEAQHKNLSIVTASIPDDIIIDADPDKIARLFMNLIQNALKYGTNATYIKLVSRLEKNFVEVRVINDGKKIPAEAVEHIFDRFYRVEGSRSTKTGGTGLGLAIALGVVEGHNGSIYATSDDSKTEFIVQVPIIQRSMEKLNAK
ncbi:HAMP domain-containing histidine kinase [Periweissella fabaria]|uniref:histidine kinase n=1 Tax=Periweissella fabaria TaxID=546157 RepID=A0ABN8BJD2_9LACO|nr:HAMP domain-containing sensor histidine kinase [Periweissella fabaria]MCM0597624.1 HAMP domain-containing histidine kinase [Periweissella fabaria]CAH0416808.1 Adaptive-response sensory-kinase SasA [Periweissella fabaria]